MLPGVCHEDGKGKPGCKTAGKETENTADSKDHTHENRDNDGKGSGIIISCCAL